MPHESDAPQDADAVVALLRLGDDEYFSATGKALLDLQDALAEAMAAHGDSPPPRVALGAPTRVDLGTRQTVPVLVGRYHTGQRAWEVNPDPNLHLFVKKHATGELLAAIPFLNLRRGDVPLLSGVGEPPDGINASATRSGVKRLDLLERFPAPGPGRLSVTAVYHELCSNTVVVDVTGGTPEAATVAHPSRYVRHTLDARPNLPTEVDVPPRGSIATGIEIRVSAQTGGEEGIVRNEFKQPLLAAHLVLVRLDERPILVPTLVPVIAVDRDDGATAHNALFLAKLGGDGHAVPAGAYQVYVEIAGALRGPFPLHMME